MSKKYWKLAKKETSYVKYIFTRILLRIIKNYSSAMDSTFFLKARNKFIELNIGHDEEKIDNCIEEFGVRSNQINPLTR